MGVTVKKFCATLVLAVAFVLPLLAAGTLTVTTTMYPGLNSANRVRYALAWTSTAGGAVSGNAFSTVRGKLLSVKVVPGAAAEQPTDLYDVTLVDTNGIDLLNSEGLNESNALGEYIVFNPPIYLDGTQTMDLVVANAGNAKTGIVYVWVEQ